ncbi:MAG: sensor histidine kinase [Pyrinomonadaceae bacterium]
MKLRLLGLLGWLAFCYLFLVFIKLRMAGSLERFFFHWDAPLWLFLDCLIGAYLFFLIKRSFNLLSENLTSVSRDCLIFISTIPVVAFIVTFWGVVIVEKLTFGKNHTYYEWVSKYLIDLITQSIVCLSCISYFYISALTKTQERLAAAQRAQSEMQLKLLQQQVDPHFLFNNLNVLSALVEKDPEIANEFLTRLAELYRYILQTQNVEIVPVKDELTFAENYLYLLKQRFGAAYDFDWQVPRGKINGQMIVPAALQGLLENVVKHNAGNQKKPLQIKIVLNEDFLAVENEICAKSNAQTESGTGLQNLAARYSFLTEMPVEVLRDETVFRVKVPLLRLKK